MANKQANIQNAPDVQWNQLARNAKIRRNLTTTVLVSIMIIISIPIIVPYFWMMTIAFSARTGGVDSFVLWRSVFILIPAIVTFSLIRIFVTKSRHHWYIGGGILLVTVIALTLLIGPNLHVDNFRFFWMADIVKDLPGRGAATVGTQFPWMWVAFRNSMVMALVQTLVVGTVSTFAGYYLSRFAFPGRSSFLQLLLVMHAFPAMTLVIPIFLIMYWTGMIDTITGVILVIVTLELPFSIFIMKGFFDAVPWDIEMSAMTDGASRRQAFFRVVLPQVKVGILAISVFSFIKGWEEYVFVRTLLFDKSNWMMSLYLFWVADDVMGVDYGIVAAVSTFFVMPSLILYIFCQKYLVQMSIGGIKG